MPNEMEKSRSSDEVLTGRLDYCDLNLTNGDEQGMLSKLVRKGGGLSSGTGRFDNIPGVLATLGTLAGASRVWVCRRATAIDGDIEQDAVFDWNVTQDVVLEKSSVFSRCTMLKELPTDHQESLLSSGGEFRKIITDRLQPSCLRQLLEKQKVRSTISVPIVIKNVMWGTLGIDNLEDEVGCGGDQIALLELTAGLIATTMAQDVSDGTINQFAGIPVDIAGGCKEDEEKLQDDAGKGARCEYFSRRRVSDIWKAQVLDEKSATLFSLIVVDLDHVKDVIANCGQVIGDLVLQHFVGVCKQYLRCGDQIGRIGQDDFLIILPSANAQSSNDIAHRIRGSFERSPYKVGDIEISTTVSIGGVGSESFKMTEQKLYKAACESLSAAQRAGRNKMIHPAIISVDSNATH